MNTSLFAVAALLTLGLVACSGEDPAPEGEAGSGGTAGSAGAAGEAGSGGGGQVQSVGVDPKISECGGFAAGQRDSLPYCDAEILQWAFDAATGTLSLIDQRVLLNCCGDHAFTVTFEPNRGVYTATETDSPEDGSGRCDCMCVFDWATDVAGVQSGTIQLELVRHETDAGASRIVWAGALDLSAVQGQVVVDPNPVGYGCDSGM